MGYVISTATSRSTIIQMLKTSRHCTTSIVLTQIIVKRQEVEIDNYYMKFYFLHKLEN